MTVGGSWPALIAFGVASGAIVALMGAVALAVALAQEQVIAILKAGAGDVKRWGGRILVAVGIWTVALALLADTFARLFPV